MTGPRMIPLPSRNRDAATDTRAFWRRKLVETEREARLTSDDKGDWYDDDAR